MDILKIEVISVTTFTDSLGIQRPPSGEQLYLVIVVNSLQLLTFCDLGTPLELTKWTSVIPTTFWNPGLTFCGVEGEEKLDAPHPPEFGEQGKYVAMAMLWVCPTIFLGKQPEIAVSTLSPSTTVSSTCDWNKQPNKTKPFTSGVDLTQFFSPGPTLRTEWCGKPKPTTSKPLLGLNYPWR